MSFDSLHSIFSSGTQFIAIVQSERQIDESSRHRHHLQVSHSRWLGTSEHETRWLPGKKVKIVYGLPGQQFPLSTVAHVKALHTRSSALSLHNHEIGNPAPTTTAMTPPVLSRRKRADACTVARSFSNGVSTICSSGRKR